MLIRRAYTKSLPCKRYARPVRVGDDLYHICWKDGEWKAVLEKGNEWEFFPFGGIHYANEKIITEPGKLILIDYGDERIELEPDLLEFYPFSPFGFFDFGVARAKCDGEWFKVPVENFDYLQIGNCYVFVKSQNSLRVVSFSQDIANFEANEAPHHDVIIGWDKKGVTFFEQNPRAFYIVSLYRYGIAGPFGVVKTSEKREWKQPTVWVEKDKAVIWNRQTPVVKRQIVTIADISIKHATVEPRFLAK